MATLTAESALRLGAELRSEFAELDRVHGEVQALHTARDSTATYALALLLMNYYTGAERLFRRIASQLGGLPPGGDRWHAQLLEDMMLELPGLRPPVLSRDTVEALARLLRLRHVLRNLYAWTVRRDELDVHTRELTATHAALTRELDHFHGFLSAFTNSERG